MNNSITNIKTTYALKKPHVIALPFIYGVNCIAWEFPHLELGHCRRHDGFRKLPGIGVRQYFRDSSRRKTFLVLVTLTVDLWPWPTNLTYKLDLSIWPPCQNSGPNDCPFTRESKTHTHTHTQIMPKLLHLSRRWCGCKNN